MFFENHRKTGGGPIETIVFSKEGQSIITYEDERGMYTQIITDIMHQNLLTGFQEQIKAGYFSYF